MGVQQRQTVLSVDLDFFVTPIAYHSSDIERLSEEEYSVEDIGTVQAFLEGQCLLDKSHAVPGTILTHNDEAFFVLREEIAQHRIATPFNLMHIDAHSDLGMGDSGYVFILTELLHRPVSRRAHDIPRDSLTFGNWIAFVIANRWISSLTFVTHPDYHSDLPWMYFKDIDGTSGVIQMRPRSQAEVDEYLNRDNRQIFASGSTQEPGVKFNAISRNAFQLAQQPDFVVVSQSPGYTPPTADHVLSVIRAFLRQ